MLNGFVVVRKHGLNKATNSPFWVIRTASFMIVKGIKVEPGSQVGGQFETKEQAKVFAEACGLKVQSSDRDY